MELVNYSFPAQKKATSKKNKKWREACVHAGQNISVEGTGSLRKSYQNKRINYNLYSDILDPNDIEKICNPMGILGLASPAKMQNYPICNPKIDLLVGESISRKFDWKVRVINDDAISEKEEELKERFTKLMTDHINAEKVDEKQMQEDLKKFDQFANYEYQDLRERRATQILSYLYKSQRLDYLFSKGFKDALICAEEIYQCDIIAGEPVVRKLNPLNVYCVRSGESPLIEDSDIITIVGYMSPGQIIDDYHEYLTPGQIDFIEDGMVGNTSIQNGLGIDIGRKPDLAIKLDDAIDISILAGNTTFGTTFDTEGNIRVTKVYWKSMRMLKKVKYFDSDGDVQYDLFDETYVINKNKGEEETIIWVSEWWEGHKLGGSSGTVEDDSAIYVKMQPRPIQFRSMENPSKCHPGIVGTIYNTNDNTGVSLMDRMKPLQYLYNVLAYNAELAIAKNRGKIMRIDLSSIPENWQIDQWLSFASGMNVAFYDSFKEGNKGAAQGKLAGTMSAQAPVIDMEMGNTIQLYMDMMAFIKEEMGEISGVTKSRQGSIQNRQAVGNTQQEMQQTSMITEYWFQEHDYVKVRVLECLLETAKCAWKDKKNKKIQFVLDDGSTTLFDVDGAQFNECEYGLQISGDGSSKELLATMKQLAQAGIQNGIMNFSQLLDIYSTDSMASIRRKITRAEEEKKQADAEQAQMEKEMHDNELKAAAIEAEKTRDFTREEWDREDENQEADRENKLEIERMRQDNVTSPSFEPVELENDNNNHLELEKLRQQAQKIENDYKIKKAQHVETLRANKVAEKHKDKELVIKRKAANKRPAAK